MLNPAFIETIVREALLEDLGAGRDITTDMLVPPASRARAVLRARKPGILAGLNVGLAAFTLTDPGFNIETHAEDGAALKAGQAVATIEGPAAALLTAERTALNFIMHLSGVATLTRRYVEAIQGTSARITCTRKTIPGMRLLQKYAVRMGGGVNHRMGLYDRVLIKDNHLPLAGGIKKALATARAQTAPDIKIEIEVDTLEQLKEVLESGGADIVLLDNMDLKTLEKAVTLAKGRILTEASGGVTLDTVCAVAKTGVDCISVGALTHSAQALDFGLDIIS